MDNTTIMPFIKSAAILLSIQIAKTFNIKTGTFMNLKNIQQSKR